MTRKRVNRSPTPTRSSPTPTPTPTGSSRSRSRKRAKLSPSRDSPPPSPPPSDRGSSRGHGRSPSHGRSHGRSRSRSRVAPATDFEIIQLLLNSVSKIDFISDDSLYSFILHVKIPTPACVTGVEVSSFCMKITFVNKGGPNEYYHTPMKGDDIEKKTIDVREIGKEVAIQRKLYESFSSPFVPRVFAASIFLNDEFIELFDSLLLSAAAVFDKNAHYVVSSIIKYVNEHPTWDVHIFLMEYKPYDTLYKRSFKSIPERSTFTPTKNQNEYQHMAANLVCTAGAGFILHDAHNKNGLYDPTEKVVVLLDVGDAFDVNDEGDIEKMKNIFIEMVRDNSHLKPHLCKFFNVQEESQLLNAFVDNLTFTDFRTQGHNIGDIHHTLMMLAFVDFMIHLPIRVWLIRCRYVMQSIYTQVGFEDFVNFLDTFTPILSSDAYNTALTNVAGFIAGITGVTSIPGIPGKIHIDKPVSKKEKNACVMQGGRRKRKTKRKRKCKTRKCY